MTGRYRYLVRKRSGPAWMGLAAGLVMLALMVDRAPPLWTWVLVGPCILVCILQIALKPGYGVGFTAGALSIFNGFSEQRLPLSRVDHLRLSDSGAVLVLRSGDMVPLPNHVMRNSLTLIREITARGIPVRSV